MLTKNFYVAMMSWLRSQTGTAIGCKMIHTGGSEEEVEPINFVTKYYFSGTNYTRYDGGIMYSVFPYLSYANISSAGIMLGCGTTPPKVTDFDVETPINADLSFSFVEGKMAWEDQYCEYTSKFTATNNDSKNVSISEMCLCCRRCTKDPQYVTMQPSYGNSVFMFDRTVLDEPVVIAPGETKTLTYTFRMNYPS